MSTADDLLRRAVSTDISRAYTYKGEAYTEFTLEWRNLVEEIRAYLDAPKDEPVGFLCDATRFKVTGSKAEGMIYGIPRNLIGKWVAFVDADNGQHLKYLHPPKPMKPMTADEIQKEHYRLISGDLMHPPVDAPKDDRVYQISSGIGEWMDVFEEYFRLFGRGHTERRILYLHPPTKTAPKKPMTEDTKQLIAAVTIARDVFRAYQAHHEYKGDKDKAERNKGYAEQMEKALSPELNTQSLHPEQDEPVEEHGISEAPKRIWTSEDQLWWDSIVDGEPTDGLTQYIRADIVEEMREALNSCHVSAKPCRTGEWVITPRFDEKKVIAALKRLEEV